MIERFWRRCRELEDDAESGQVFVEFVVVFPVQLFLTLCVLQFAFMAHATIVVNQASFMGARAAAVAAANPEGIAARDAALRVVGRNVALLTTGGGEITGGITPAGNPDFEWNSSGGAYGFSQARKNEAYAQLSNVPISVRRMGTDSGKGGYVYCDVTFDYIMTVPVANHFFAKVTLNGGQNGRTTYRVHRVGFVPIPWTQAPVN